MNDQSGDLSKFLRSLRAVREYTPEPIADDVLRDIIEVGRWSGSSGNSQPTEVVLVRNRDHLKLIGENGVRAAPGAAAALVVITPGDAARTALESFDNGRLVERILLAAKAHRLGSNISTLKGEGPNLVRQALGIPAEKGVWTVITLGHTDEAAYKARTRNANPGRKANEQFIHWDHY